jgi:hypothetical protein
MPPGADTYRMSSILHDWPAERVIEAMTTVRDPMNDHARLLWSSVSCCLNRETKAPPRRRRSSMI